MSLQLPCRTTFRTGMPMTFIAVFPARAEFMRNLPGGTADITVFVTVIIIGMHLRLWNDFRYHNALANGTDFTYTAGIFTGWGYRNRFRCPGMAGRFPMAALGTCLPVAPFICVPVAICMGTGFGGGFCW